MMKLLYAHDHKFYKYKKDYYSGGSFPKDALLRYTSVFEDVTFVSRQISVDKEPINMSLATTERVDFVEIPNFKSLKSYHNKRKAKKIIQNKVKDADCIIARLPSSIGSLAVKYAQKYHKPYLVEVVGCALDGFWTHGSILGKIIAPFEFLNMRRIVRNSKHTIYVTKDFLQKRYPTEGISTNCSNVEILENSQQVFDNRIYKIDRMDKEEKYKIGMIGALDGKFKGFDIAIKAMGLVNKIQDNVELHIVGPGDPKEWRILAEKEGIENKVIFHGTLPNGQPVFDWLDSVDIYIQPSRTEGLPRSIIEAMSRGCPVIGSNVGGIPELLDEDCIFDNFDHEELANMILEHGLDKDWLKRKAKVNFEEAKHYNKEKIDKRRREFLNSFKNASKIFD